MRDSLKDASDELLVEKVLTGERAAFDLLYGRFLPKVYGFVYRRVGNREDAENATSQVFMKSFTRLSSFRGGSFSAWLFAIAKNEVADYWRDRYRREMALAGLVVERSNSHSLDDFEEDKEKAGRLATAILERLPENYRRVLELRFLQSLTLLETAEALGTSEGNVKVMQHRALRKAAEVGCIE